MKPDQSDAQIYSELRRIAASQLRRERRRGTLMDTTVLVHEAWMRLSADPQTAPWDTRGHFYASAARAMRRILVEQARRSIRRARAADRAPRSESSHSTSIDPAELIALDEALVRFEEHDPRAAAVVNLRFFAGLDMPQIAEITGLSLRTAEREWFHARAWLQKQMGTEGHLDS